MPRTFISPGATAPTHAADGHRVDLRLDLRAPRPDQPPHHPGTTTCRGRQRTAESFGDQRARPPCRRNGNDGIGKPEPLQHGFHGLDASLTNIASRTRSAGTRFESPPVATTTA